MNNLSVTPHLISDCFKTHRCCLHLLYTNQCCGQLHFPITHIGFSVLNIVNIYIFNIQSDKRNANHDIQRYVITTWQYCQISTNDKDKIFAININTYLLQL